MALTANWGNPQVSRHSRSAARAVRVKFGNPVTAYRVIRAAKDGRSRFGGERRQVPRPFAAALIVADAAQSTGTALLPERPRGASRICADASRRKPLSTRDGTTRRRPCRVAPDLFLSSNCPVKDQEPWSTHFRLGLCIPLSAQSRRGKVEYPRSPEFRPWWPTSAAGESSGGRQAPENPIWFLSRISWCRSGDSLSRRDFKHLQRRLPIRCNRKHPGPARRHLAGGKERIAIFGSWVAQPIRP